MSTEPPPSPRHILRTHIDPITALFCSSDNERIYSGDAKGRVVLTSTRSLRPIANWLTHTDALLGVEEFGDRFGLIITHGRDNKIHVWERPEESVSIRQVGAATLSESSTPTLCYSMDVNALNYCRFSLLPIQPNISLGGEEVTALIAVPNLVESSLADVWTLPGRKRLHAAIGEAHDTASTKFSDGRSGSKTGIIMAMHLFYAPQIHPSTSTAQRELRLLCAYEDGGVVLRKRTTPEGEQTIAGQGWETIWKSKLHVESADHLIGKYDLTLDPSETGAPGTIFRTKCPGNGAISIRGDGRVCAVGGWDGKYVHSSPSLRDDNDNARVRLYSTKSFKALGTLVYHKQGCQAVTFASFSDGSLPSKEEDEEDEMTLGEKRQRSRWLITSGKDARVSIWALMSFEKTT
ncbi:hypothetical protein ID866_7688 [Astraeus odoratus]|nr:hypothetical protein ID866_7688 [Astraeus odoratus]